LQKSGPLVRVYCCGLRETQPGLCGLPRLDLAWTLLWGLAVRQRG